MIAPARKCGYRRGYGGCDAGLDDAEDQMAVAMMDFHVHRFPGDLGITGGGLFIIIQFNRMASIILRFHCRVVVR